MNRKERKAINNTRKQQKADKKMTKEKMKSTIKGIMSNGSKYMPWIVVALICIIGMVVLSIFAPNILSDFTNLITNYPNPSKTTIEGFNGVIINAGDSKAFMENVGIYGGILIGLYAGNAVLGYCASFIMTSVSQYYSKDLRTAMSKKINRLPLSYFDTRQYGDILSVVTNDIDQLGQSMQQSISMMFQSIFTLIGALIAMFVTSWQMAITVLCTLPLMIAFMAFALILANPQFIRRQKKLGEIEGEVEETYNGQLVIKAFNAQDKTNAAFEKSNHELKRTMFLAEICGGTMQPFMSLISYVAYAAVFVTGGLLLNAQVAGFTYGTITAFMIYINLFQSPLSQIAQALNQMQMGVASGNRVFEFLGAKEQENDSNLPSVFENKNGKEVVKGEVEFNHVNFSYDDSRVIIPDFSASVKPGMKVAIVGPTGAGKTTMVNLLMRFYEVNGGSISIDGIPTKDMQRKEVRDVFGMVLQDTWVFAGTLRENLVYNTPNVTDEQIQQAIHDAHLVHYVRTLPGGLDYYIEDGNTISGGQRQLITIARAMIKNAPLLILDEATSNVDTRTEEKIEESMDRLTKGRTSFVIAHRLSTIRNADLILVMKDGNIIEQGTHDSLMNQNGFYASLYNSQFSME